ncbi:MAG: hypothetical protein ACYDIB_05655 [Desulfobulbia bacterium]|nr:MAG: hypothetical protein CVU58_00720 [Deltaproteobacteria bacterium HGW-Deltaproteobacteria-16]
MDFIAKLDIMPFLLENPIYFNLIVCFLIAHIAYLRLKNFIEFRELIKERKVVRIEKAIEAIKKNNGSTGIYDEIYKQELLHYSLGVKATKNQRKAIQILLDSGHATAEDIKSSVFYIGLKNGSPEIKLGKFELLFKIYLFGLFLFTVFLSYIIFSWLLDSNQITKTPLSILLPIAVLAGGWAILSGSFPILAAERILKNINGTDKKKE